MYQYDRLKSDQVLECLPLKVKKALKSVKFQLTLYYLPSVSGTSQKIPSELAGKYNRICLTVDYALVTLTFFQDN